LIYPFSNDKINKRTDMFGLDKFIIVLKSKYIEGYDNGGNLKIRIEIPMEAVEKQEVRDVKKFTDFVHSKFSFLRNKQISILLSNEIVYFKEIKHDANQGLQIQAFIDEIPINNTSITVKTLPIKDKVYVVGTNRELYENLADILESLGNRVVNVVPAFLFPNANKVTLASGDVKNVFRSLAKDKFIDFNDKGKRKEARQTSIVRIEIMALVLGGSLVFLFVMIFMRSQSKPAAVEIATPVPVVSPSASPLPTLMPTSSASAQLARKDLLVLVLNGTKVAGRAAEMKDFLEELGYTVVDIGNAPTRSYLVTNILLREESKEYTQMLFDDLRTTYEVASPAARLEDEGEHEATVIVGER